MKDYMQPDKYKNIFDKPYEGMNSSGSGISISYGTAKEHSGEIMGESLQGGHGE